MTKLSKSCGTAGTTNHSQELINAGYKLVYMSLIQSTSIIVESVIVEKSIIVDNLPSTNDFYLIKIQNSRNSKIVELFLGKVA